MKKRRIGILLMMMLLMIGVIPVSAVSNVSKLVDNESLLFDDEFEELNDYIDEQCQLHDFDFIVVTTDSFDGKSAQDYADDYYTDHGYDEDGILLLVSVGEGAYHISTHGYGMDAFYISDLEDMEDLFVPEIRDGDYMDAFKDFVDSSAQVLEMARTRSNNAASDSATSVNGDYDDSQEYSQDYSYVEESRRESPLRYLIPAVAFGIFVSFVITGSKKAALKSVDYQSYANAYIKNQNLTMKRDIFLYHTITRTARPKKSERSGGDNGGHMSSRGGSFGGHGGRL